MKKIYFLAFLSLLLACDDGDYNIPSLDFDGLTINNCGDIVFSKITSSGTESLILQIDEDNTDDIFFKTPLDSLPISIAADSDNTMYYRIFDASINNSYFCQEIPPSTPLVTEEWFGEGTLYITNTIILDDNDGVPAEIENNLDISMFGDVPDDFDINDIDGDGYPNYIDIDDDGDNKLTINEDIDINLPISNTDDPSTVDTDGDGIPNYLDTDDDNDGVLSIEESDTNDENNNTIVNYLDVDDNTAITAASPVTNTYSYSYSMLFEFVTLTLYNDDSTINYSSGYTFGTKTGTFTSSDLPSTEEK